MTRILSEVADGDEAAVSRLLEAVYDELRNLAASRLRPLGPGQTLRPTDLVHEAYLKLVHAPARDWESRRHFINAAGTAMRSILTDRARAIATEKRGGDREREPLHPDIVGMDRDPSEILAIDEALEDLQKVDERAARVVTLRVFLGLPEAEIAGVLGVTDRTVQRDWKFAKAWLARRMPDGRGLDDASDSGNATHGDEDDQPSR